MDISATPQIDLNKEPAAKRGSFVEVSAAPVAKAKSGTMTEITPKVPSGSMKEITAPKAPPTSGTFKEISSGTPISGTFKEIPSGAPSQSGTMQEISFGAPSRSGTMQEISAPSISQISLTATESPSPIGIKIGSGVGGVSIGGGKIEPITKKPLNFSFEDTPVQKPPQKAVTTASTTSLSQPVEAYAGAGLISFVKSAKTLQPNQEGALVVETTMTSLPAPQVPLRPLISLEKARAETSNASLLASLSAEKEGRSKNLNTAMPQRDQNYNREYNVDRDGYNRDRDRDQERNRDGRGNYSDRDRYNRDRDRDRDQERDRDGRSNYSDRDRYNRDRDRDNDRDRDGRDNYYNRDRERDQDRNRTADNRDGYRRRDDHRDDRDFRDRDGRDNRERYRDYRR